MIDFYWTVELQARKFRVRLESKNKTWKPEKIG
jgi:hypothetical protein